MNHNVWVYLDAGRRANETAFNDPSHSIPTQFRSVLEIIDTAFEASDWTNILTDARLMLDYVAPSKYS